MSGLNLSVVVSVDEAGRRSTINNKYVYFKLALAVDSNNQGAEDLDGDRCLRVVVAYGKHNYNSSIAAGLDREAPKPKGTRRPKLLQESAAAEQAGWTHERLVVGQDSEEALETVVSDLNGKAPGYRPARKVVLSETETIISRIIGKQRKGMLSQELEKVLESETQSKIILDEMAHRR
jgi:hypothetical protein